jgi:hypothetical protein
VPTSIRGFKYRVARVVVNSRVASLSTQQKSTSAASMAASAGCPVTRQQRGVHGEVGPQRLQPIGHSYHLRKPQIISGHAIHGVEEVRHHDFQIDQYQYLHAHLRQRRGDERAGTAHANEAWT